MVSKKQGTEVAAAKSAVALNPAGEMLQMAMADSNVDLDKMEKIMQMYERVEAQKAEREYNAAMANLQGNMPDIPKDGKIVVKGELRSEYSKFETIMGAIKPHLLKNGIAVSFRSTFDQGKAVVECVISHKDGHREATSITLPFDESGAKNSVQKIGSSLSYAKRYALCLILNIPTGGEDDDGNKGGDKKEPAPKKKSALVIIGEKLVEALDLYQGDDEQAIRDLCKAKREAGEFNLKFAKEILKQVS